MQHSLNPHIWGAASAGPLDEHRLWRWPMEEKRNCKQAYTNKSTPPPGSHANVWANASVIKA
eukprot:4249727-Amphidinium_carterae.1